MTPVSFGDYNPYDDIKKYQSTLTTEYIYREHERYRKLDAEMQLDRMTWQMRHTQEELADLRDKVKQLTKKPPKKEKPPRKKGIFSRFFSRWEILNRPRIK